MSRHRNVRSMDYTDEYDGYDDVYGHSVDEDSCISPSDAQQWIYDRARGQQSISEFIATHRDIEEEDEEYERRNSESFEMPQLNDEDRARLESCMDEIRNVVGESISDRQMIETILKHKFDCAKSLDDILNNSETSKNNVSKENTSAGGSGIAAAPGGASITKEAVEKDLNPNTLADLLKQRNIQINHEFKIPDKKLLFNKQFKNDDDNNNNNNNNTKKFSNLSEFANFHLEISTNNNNNNNNNNMNNTSEAKIDETIAADQINKTTKFIIPKLENLKISNNLQNKLNKNKYLTPHEISMKRIMDIKKIQISENNGKSHLSSTTPPPSPSPSPSTSSTSSLLTSTSLLSLPLSQLSQSLPADVTPSPLSNDNFIIDLRTALNNKNTINESILKSKSKDNIPDNNFEINFNKNFQPKFYDCDILEQSSSSVSRTTSSSSALLLLPTIMTHNCELDVKNILDLKLKIYTKNVSSLGKILCTKYRRKIIPYVRHEFIQKYAIKKFDYNSPSPDDIASKYLNK